MILTKKIRSFLYIFLILRLKRNFINLIQIDEKQNWCAHHLDDQQKAFKSSLCFQLSLRLGPVSCWPVASWPPCFNSLPSMGSSSILCLFLPHLSSVLMAAPSFIGEQQQNKKNVLSGAPKKQSSGMSENKKACIDRSDKIVCSLYWLKGKRPFLYDFPYMMEFWQCFIFLLCFYSKKCPNPILQQQPKKCNENYIPMELYVYEYVDVLI